jgi:FkbM family methyltransferase
MIIAAQVGTTERAGHHPVFESFERTLPYDDDRYHHNFVGARIAHKFERDLIDVVPALNPGSVAGLKASGRSSRYDDDPTYPYKLSEDYFEWIDLLEAIERSHSIFTMIEVGAGYGRWIANAAAALRRLKKSSTPGQKLIGLEANKTRFDFMQQNCDDNGIAASDLSLLRVACSPDGRPTLMVCNDDYGAAVFQNEQLLRTNADRFTVKDASGRDLIVEKVPAIRLETVCQDFIDFLDMDIQGAELDVIFACIDWLDKHVRMIHVGTHSLTVDARLSHIFHVHGWHARHIFSCGQINQTPYGAFRFVDGISSWENPNL